MVKFEKQVAKNKISHFLKKSQLVIIIHCMDHNDFYKKLTESLITKKSSFLSETINNDSVSKIAELKKFIRKEGLSVKLVKNNYAKKALIESSAFLNKLYIDKSSDSRSHIFTKSASSKTNPLFSSLFQGNNVLIGFQKASSLAKIKDFIEDKRIDILGAIYENRVIDHNQIKSLASKCSDKLVYTNFVNVLKNPSFQLTKQLHSNLDFSNLLHLQCKLIYFFKILYSQK